LVDEDPGDPDEPALPSDSTELGDPADLEMFGIYDWRRRVDEGDGRRLIKGSGCALVESLMGPLLIEDSSEGVEGALLGGKAGTRWAGGFAFEGTVHALMPAVLLRFAGLDEFGCDAEADPPGGEGADASEGDRGGEGLSVVGADAFRHAVGSKEAAETLDAEGGVWGGECPAVEEEATEGVLDGEGVAELAVPGLEVALEVDGPEGVGTIRLQG